MTRDPIASFSAALIAIAMVWLGGAVLTVIGLAVLFAAAFNLGWDAAEKAR